jgi:hypothetical protein
VCSDTNQSVCVACLAFCEEICVLCFGRGVCTTEKDVVCVCACASLSLSLHYRERRRGQ